MLAAEFINLRRDGIEKVGGGGIICLRGSGGSDDVFAVVSHFDVGSCFAYVELGEGSGGRKCAQRVGRG